MPAWLESAWLARYLDRQLSDDEGAWFEAYLLDKPELLGMVEIDAQVRDALAAEPASWRSFNDSDSQRGAKDNVVCVPRPDISKDTPELRSQSSGPGNSSAGLPRWAALAATLVVGLGLGLVGERALPPREMTPEVIASPMRVVYDTMRGEATAARVENAESLAPYALIEVAVPPDAEFVTLRIGGAASMSLTSSPDGFVGFLIDRRVSGPAVGSIEYQSKGQRNSREISFTVIHKENK